MGLLRVRSRYNGNEVVAPLHCLGHSPSINVALIVTINIVYDTLQNKNKQTNKNEADILSVCPNVRMQIGRLLL